MAKLSPLVGRYGRNRVLACDYPEARRSAEYFPYESRSPGPIVGKAVPKMRNYAMLLYGIYFGLTALEFIFLIVGKMPVFDALT